MQSVHPSKISKEILFEFTSPFGKAPSRKASNFDFGFNPLKGKAKYIRDSDWMYMYSGPHFDVVSSKNGQRRAFANLELDDENKYDITCACEIPNHITGKFSGLMVLGISVNDCSSLLCIFDCRVSSIKSLIKFHEIITSVDIIYGIGIEGFHTDMLADEIHFMQTAACIGTIIGKSFIVDLNINSETSSTMTVLNSSPQIVDVCVMSLPFSNVSSLRESLLQKDKLMAIALESDEEDISTRSAVTAMLYIPHLLSVAIGFSDGTIHLWNLNKLCLDVVWQSLYETPVHSFAFLEPDNDPRNFCYILVGYSDGSSIDKLNDGSASLLLFSLSYQHKDYVEGYGTVYQGLVNDTCKLKVDLSKDPIGETDDICPSQLVSIKTLVNPLGLYQHDNSDDLCSNIDLSMCLISWCVKASKDQCHYFLAIFDLNQWYQCQMPSEIFTDSNDNCPFFGLFSMPPVKNDEVFIMDTKLAPNLLYPPQVKVASEIIQYPISYGFSVSCITKRGFVSVTYMGLQEYALQTLDTQGAISLLEVDQVIDLLTYSGLICDSQPECYVETVLTLLLHQKRMSFIKSCIGNWVEGNYLPAGFSLESFEKWAWDSVFQLKNQVNDICIPLFDMSGSAVVETAYSQLKYAEGQYRCLLSIYETLVDLAPPTTNEGLSSLEQKSVVIQTLTDFVSMLLWFLSCGLLPECPQDWAPHSCEIVYKSLNLKSSYYEERTRKYPLFIDLLVSKYGSQIKELWSNRGGDGNYPPPSIQSLLDIYMIHDVPLMHKHRIVQYLLLDIASQLDGERYKAVLEKMVRFSSSFFLRPSLIKVTQAYWLIDHHKDEMGITMLSDGLVDNNDFEPEQHSLIVRHLLATSQPQLAMSYWTVFSHQPQTEDNVWLYVNMFIQNDKIHDALQYIRKNKTYIDFAFILKRFFAACWSKQKYTIKLIESSLTHEEEELFVDFVKKEAGPTASDILVYYYTVHSRLDDALLFAEKAPDNPNDFILMGYRNVIPPVLYHSALQLKRLKSDKKKEIILARRPTPLTMQIKPCDLPTISQEKYIRTVLETKLQIDASLSEDLHSTAKKRKVDGIDDITVKRRKIIKDVLSTSSKSSSNYSKTPTGHLKEDILKLLSTPNVAENPNKLYDVTPITRTVPHSILKSRFSPKSSKWLVNTEFRRHRNSSKGHLPPAIDDTVKQLRFDIPSPPKELATPRSPAELVEEESGLKEQKEDLIIQEDFTGISTRMNTRLSEKNEKKEIESTKEQVLFDVSKKENVTLLDYTPEKRKSVTRSAKKSESLLQRVLNANALQNIEERRKHLGVSRQKITRQSPKNRLSKIELKDSILEDEEEIRLREEAKYRARLATGSRKSILLEMIKSKLPKMDESETEDETESEDEDEETCDPLAGTPCENNSSGSGTSAINDSINSINTTHSSEVEVKVTSSSASKPEESVSLSEHKDSKENSTEYLGMSITHRPLISLRSNILSPSSKETVISTSTQFGQLPVNIMDRHKEKIISSKNSPWRKYKSLKHNTSHATTLCCDQTSIDSPHIVNTSTISYSEHRKVHERGNVLSNSVVSQNTSDGEDSRTSLPVELTTLEEKHGIQLLKLDHSSDEMPVTNDLSDGEMNNSVTVEVTQKTANLISGIVPGIETTNALYTGSTTESVPLSNKELSIAAQSDEIVDHSSVTEAKPNKNTIKTRRSSGKNEGLSTLSNKLDNAKEFELTKKQSIITEVVGSRTSLPQTDISYDGHEITDAAASSSHSAISPVKSRSRVRRVSLKETSILETKELAIVSNASGTAQKIELSVIEEPKVISKSTKATTHRSRKASGRHERFSEDLGGTSECFDPPFQVVDSDNVDLEHVHEETEHRTQRSRRLVGRKRISALSDDKKSNEALESVATELVDDVQQSKSSKLRSRKVSGKKGSTCEVESIDEHIDNQMITLETHKASKKPTRKVTSKHAVAALENVVLETEEAIDSRSMKRADDAIVTGKRTRLRQRSRNSESDILDISVDLINQREISQSPDTTIVSQSKKSSRRSTRYSQSTDVSDSEDASIKTRVSTRLKSVTRRRQPRYSESDVNEFEESGVDNYQGPSLRTRNSTKRMLRSKSVEASDSDTASSLTEQSPVKTKHAVTRKRRAKSEEVDHNDMRRRSKRRLYSNVGLYHDTILEEDEADSKLNASISSRTRGKSIKDSGLESHDDDCLEASVNYESENPSKQKSSRRTRKIDS